jgi:hypothetical protein
MTNKEIIYEMLTEDTGIHMLDSGGDDNRHFQKNQKKSITDFINEPYETLENDGEYKYYSRSLFHHLNNTCEYLEQETKDFNNWVKQDLYNYDNPNGRAFNCMYDAHEYMSKTYAYDFRSENTCNFDNDLDQGIMFVYDWDCDIIALSVHNGADCRGGYTDFKLFRIDESFLYMSTEVEDEEVA